MQGLSSAGVSFNCRVFLKKTLIGFKLPLRWGAAQAGCSSRDGEPGAEHDNAASRDGDLVSEFLQRCLGASPHGHQRKGAALSSTGSRLAQGQVPKAPGEEVLSGPLHSSH